MTKAETITLTKATTEIKFMQDDLKEVKETLKSLPDELINKLDERYARASEMKEVQETLAPFTKFRRNLWYSVVFTALGVALLIYIETKK